MPKPEDKKTGLKNEIIGIGFLAVALLIVFSLIFYHIGTDASKGVGIVGNNISWILFAGMGYTAYVFPFLLFYLAFVFLVRQGEGFRWTIPISLLLVVISFCGIFAFVFSDAIPGGLLGDIVKRNATPLLGAYGSIIVLVALLVVSLRIGTGLPLVKIAGVTLVALGVTAKYAYNGAAFLIDMIRDKGKDEEKKKSKVKKEKPDDEEEEEVIEKKGDKKEVEEPVKKEKPKQEPNIITLTQEKQKKKKPEPVQEELGFVPPKGTFVLPSTTLLEAPSGSSDTVDKETLLTNSKILEKKLKDFDVDGAVVEVRSGPVVTTYEFEPAPGVKVNKITNLSDDLALALRAQSIRILAPVPGKAVVGIEVPNPTKSSITLREILEGNDFKKNKSNLSLAIGKDISGDHYVTDLAKMPHLLVAGTTGSGKSVSINVMILSILFKSTPDDVRFLMVDPKMLELSLYEGIPHLLTPVITDVKRATGMLKSAVMEMEKRYKLMSELGAKNIERYNELVGEKPTHNDTDHRKLPFIVVVIDELADLMMTSGKDVEDALVRLSQMARAAGIHLIVATQRPSVDVITGLIKTNFPARISFQVPSKTDSRTVLDASGAESLLGQGDMLFMPPGAAKLSRLHGCYVSEKEIKKVTDFLKKQARPVYQEEIISTKTAEKIEEEDDLGAEFMSRYREAVEMAEKMDMISTSYIQRRFRIGYNTAARIIEKMEQEGIVGPAQGSRPREVLKKSLEQ